LELERDRAGVILRAEKLRLGERKLSAAQTVQALLPRKAGPVAKTPIRLAGRDIGTYCTNGRGLLLITLKEASIPRGSASLVVKALAEAIAAADAMRTTEQIPTNGEEK
jgi:hypothetical protein